MATLVRERELFHAVVQDRDGNILHDGWTEDAPVLRREYDDGTIEIIRKSDGKLLNRYNLNA